MSKSFQCPFCGMIMPITPDTTVTHHPSFHYADDSSIYGSPTYTNSCIALTFHKCPNCEKFSIIAKGKGALVDDVDMQIRPKSLAKQYPDYVPSAIRQDYEEAYAIVKLSPKASATLSRRCLQGMIRDFWGIQKSRLIDEIAELQHKIPAMQWKVLDGVRRIGNIGAHMEKDINLIIDIDPNEAEKLLKLIEQLMEQWYINRHEQELLYADIIGIDTAKQSERKKTE